VRAILTYHSIDASGSAISVDPTAFAEQLKWLASGRVQVLPLADLVQHDGGDAVALTFDDGFRNFHAIAAPLLAHHGLPATVFIVADQVGRTNAWGDRSAPGIPVLPLMTWREVEEVRALGIEVGGHTRTHPPLAGLPAEQLADEVVGGRDIIARQLGERPRSFAYPYGSVDSAAMAVVRDAYVLGCTTELHELRAVDAPAALPRLDMYYWRRPGALATWNTPGFRVSLWARAQGRKLRAWAGAMGMAA
jgi:peptidoglycan/xylan/chitin deacetylase (PgdA/CDA1 family)